MPFSFAGGQKLAAAVTSNAWDMREADRQVFGSAFEGNRTYLLPQDMVARFYEWQGRRDRQPGMQVFPGSDFLADLPELPMANFGHVGNYHKRNGFCYGTARAI
jgi:hypothetical protein